MAIQSLVFVIIKQFTAHSSY